MIVTLEQLLASSAEAAGRDARRAQRKTERTGVRPVPLTAQELADALAAKRAAREDRARRRAARQAAGKHRKGRR
jgi:hypothetical protein